MNRVLVKFSTNTLQNTPFLPRASSEKSSLNASTIFSLTHRLFYPFFSTLVAFSTILPFYLGAHSCYFSPKKTAFYPQNRTFLVPFTHIYHLFSTIRNGFKPIPTMQLYAFYPSFCCILPCVLLHFTLRFAPKRTPFSTKTHAI